MGVAVPSVLVVGGAGYIGSHIVCTLCDQGYDVAVFDNLSMGNESNIDSRATFIKGDILNNNDLHNVFKKKYDSLFHLAALKSTDESMLSPEKYATANIVGTINILKHMIDYNIRNIIFSSSATVYGIPQFLPIDETHPLNPINFYGFTKSTIENILHWYSQLRKIRFSALRYFNAAGYDLHGRIRGLENNPSNLLPIIMETAMGKRKSIEVFGADYNTHDGTAIRDYIHVTDLAVAHISALEYMQNNNENLILNLATGKGYSVLDIIKYSENIIGEKIAYNMVERRAGDLGKLIAISGLAEKKINWTTQFSNIKTIIQSMWSIYNKH